MSISQKSKKDLIEHLLNAGFLTDREKDILKMRVGIEGYQASTLQEIGDKYSITRERVRQIGASIVRRVKKNDPSETQIVSSLFTKAWVPKYLVKKRKAVRRRAGIRRKKTIIRGRYKKLVSFIIEFSHTGHGKEKIDEYFKELRISYRRNKSLFEPYLVSELKRWRKRYMEIKRTGTYPSPEEGLENKEEESTNNNLTDQGEIS